MILWIKLSLNKIIYLFRVGHVPKTHLVGWVGQLQTDQFSNLTLKLLRNKTFGYELSALEMLNYIIKIEPISKLETIIIINKFFY